APGRHVGIVCAAPSARVNVSVFYQLLTPPSGLGLLASPSRQVPFRSGSAWLGRSQKDGLPVLPPREKSDFSAVRFKGLTSRTGEGQPGRFPFLEPVSKSFEENNEAGKLDKAEEIAGVVLPANEDPALPLNPGEEAFDEPASHVAA